MWPIPFASLALNTGSDKSGFLVTELEMTKERDDLVDLMLNGANGKAFDTDAFAVLTDFVNVGRAVETALEDAWMANIFFYFFVRV